MPVIPIRLETSDTTRERILKAAMLRFSAHSYEDTGLRDIAADVGVDMAYVHRCFGSKEKLFHEAVKAAFQVERVFAGDPARLPDTLAKDSLATRGANEIHPLDIVVRSFSSTDASRVLRDVVNEDVIKPLLDKRSGVGEKRAVLVCAFLAGVGILKDVIRSEALQEGGGGELELLISQVISGLLDVEAADEGRASGVSPEQGRPQ